MKERKTKISIISSIQSQLRADIDRREYWERRRKKRKKKTKRRNKVEWSRESGEENKKGEGKVKRKCR